MSSHFLGNSIKLENVYIASTGTVCGPLEYQGPLGSSFDKGFGDYHCGEDAKRFFRYLFKKREIKAKRY